MADYQTDGKWQMLSPSRKEVRMTTHSWRTIGQYPSLLLATLEKVVEAVIATRIAYLTKVYKPLPNNHFGARKQKSTAHVISYLQVSILDTWRGKKTLSLVSFDVRGAYNNAILAFKIRGILPPPPSK